MIQDPVVYSDDERAVIDAFLARPEAQCTGGYWESPEVQEIKDKAKSHYIKCQRNRCCYCNQQNRSTNHRIWDLEHIVPKNKHPRFMFEPRNLAAACPDCNIAKGEAESLKNPRRATYPRNPPDFKIIHAHYDDFEDHLYWNGGSIYFPKTDKGRLTIYMCNLLRFAQEYLELPAKPLDRRFEESLDQLQGFDPMVSANAGRRLQTVVNRERERMHATGEDPWTPAIIPDPI